MPAALTLSKTARVGLRTLAALHCRVRAGGQPAGVLAAANPENRSQGCQLRMRRWVRRAR